MDRFYAELAPFDRFTDFADVRAYTAMPDDWLVFCADVRGSTQAIKSGRYKEVNLIGAACITAVLNISGDIEVPFVFGGDGAVIVVPASLRQSAGSELVAVRQMASTKFDLDLRVGGIPVQDLRALDVDVAVRKYRLSPGNFLAMFTGGGLEMADKLLKSDSTSNKYILQPDLNAGPPGLEGLSCRWEPLVPRGGVMLTLMVKAKSTNAVQEQRLMSEVLAAVSETLGPDAGKSSPATPASMKLRWPPRNAWKEALMTTGGRFVLTTYLSVMFSSLVQVWCHCLGKKVGDYDGKTYADELRVNTDYRKYDDMLRMVLDVTGAQADAIEDYLHARFEAGEVVYGSHRANSALMTCVVFNLRQSEHIHFVDGADGGFAVAAMDLKARISGEAAD